MKDRDNFETNYISYVKISVTSVILNYCPQRAIVEPQKPNCKKTKEGLITRQSF